MNAISFFKVNDTLRPVSKTVNKIGQLYNVESFIQVDFLKGYKYVDKAGELVNSYYIDDQEPQFSMSMAELQIKPLDGVTEEVKISPKAFWSHYLLPNSLDQIATSFQKNTERVLKILEVETIKRIGWRNYFIYELGENQEAEREQILGKFALDTGLTLENMTFKTSHNEYKFNVTITKASRKSESHRPAILIDIDIYQDELNIRPNEISKKMDVFRKELQDKFVLDFINSILKK